VEEVGPGVTSLRPGDHIVLSFIPSCGHCQPCVSGRQNLCDLGAEAMQDYALDGTHRVHSHGKGVGAFCYLGTFSPYCVVPVNSAIKIDSSVPLDKAAIVSCGVPTGWGSAVYAAETRIGDTVVVIGVGGVGINAVQGARHAGAAKVIAVDPVAFKREMAPEFGATHTAAGFEEAADLVGELTGGTMADCAIVAIGVGQGKYLDDVQMLVRKGGVVVLPSSPPMLDRNVTLDLNSFAMSGKRLQGTVYGSCNPANDIPMLLGLYMDGALKLDELITNTYTLEEINKGYQDMQSGKNLRGIITFD